MKFEIRQRDRRALLALVFGLAAYAAMKLVAPEINIEADKITVDKEHEGYIVFVKIFTPK